MLSAIGSSSFPASSASGASVGALEAQLAQCERQLSDWVNCASAKTLEGKAIIQKLSDKVSEIKHRIEAADKTGSVSQPTVLKVNTSATTSSDGNGIGSPEPKPAINPISVNSSVTATVGGLINIFA
jgi:hypothetical protein